MFKGNQFIKDLKMNLQKTLESKILSKDEKIPFNSFIASKFEILQKKYIIYEESLFLSKNERKKGNKIIWYSDLYNTFYSFQPRIYFSLFSEYLNLNYHFCRKLMNFFFFSWKYFYISNLNFENENKDLHIKGIFCLKNPFKKIYKKISQKEENNINRINLLILQKNNEMIHLFFSKCTIPYLNFFFNNLFNVHMYIVTEQYDVSLILSEILGIQLNCKTGHLRIKKNTFYQNKKKKEKCLQSFIQYNIKRNIFTVNVHQLNAKKKKKFFILFFSVSLDLINYFSIIIYFLKVIKTF